MKEAILKIIYYVYGRPLSTLIIWSVLILVFWTIINYFTSKRVTKILNLCMALLIVSVIFFFTLTHRSVRLERAIELMPFWSFMSYGSRQSAWLNAFFFLPLGLSLPYILPDKIKHKALGTIIIAFAFSTLIEAVQYIFALGLCETDDVIMNTLGAAIGTLSFIISDRIKKRNRKQ